jgi:hypothetical protein
MSRHAQRQGEIGLRIEVNQQYFFTQLNQTRTDIDGTGCFAYTTFMIQQ